MSIEREMERGLDLLLTQCRVSAQRAKRPEQRIAMSRLEMELEALRARLTAPAAPQVHKPAQVGD